MSFKPSHWQPLFDTLIVALYAEEQEGEILLPDSAKKETVTALVEETGPGALQEDGTHRPLQVKRGDLVIVNLDPECLDLGNGYHVVREYHVWAVKKKA